MIYDNRNNDLWSNYPLFADFWTEIVSTDLLSSFELRIIAVILKQLNFKIWMVIDYKSIAKKLNLAETEVTQVIQKLIDYEIIECKGDCLKQSYYRYRLNSNFGWNKSIYWVFSDGIDWQAFLNSFQKLQKKFDLIIRAIENKSSGTLVIQIEVSALANRAEVEKCLKREYNLELNALEEKYRSKHNKREIAVNQQNNTNLLKIIESIVKTTNNCNHITDSKAEARPPIELAQQNLNHNNSINQEEETKNYSPIVSKQKQTLEEAVAEQEQLSNQSDVAKVDKKVVLDDVVDTQDERSFLKSKIKARLNKHCH